MVEPYNPNPPRPEDAPPVRTDMESLITGGVTAQVEERAREKTPQSTSFEALRSQGEEEIPRLQHRTVTDLLIDGLTPFLIFLMVYALMFYLLDVRYVFTAVESLNLRFTVFFFIMGVVALNRLVARDGKETSLFYALALGGVAVFYTFAMSSLYGVGSFTGGFMDDNPWVALGFNVGLVVLLWWVVNRLTHECCVDENRVAGDVGILTGTARKFRHALKKREGARKPPAPRTPAKSMIELPWIELEPIDPHAPREKAAESAPPPPEATERLSRRHPGMSIFYFSLPAMILFALGLRVVQHGGDAMVLAGHFYMGVYAVSALMLLMLTSLGGLRQYFRARYVHLPAMLGPFWIGLGALMVAAVLVAATQLPLPGLPEIAYIENHEADPWKQNAKFELVEVTATPVKILQQSRFMDRVGKLVLFSIALVLLYGILKGLASLAAVLARSTRLPPWLLRLFAAIDRVLTVLTRVPQLPKREPRVRVSRQVARSVNFESTLSDPEAEQVLDIKDHVQHAYAALCALAADLGVPRRDDETPYEFADRMPRRLGSLRKDARALSRLYVVAAYSPLKMDERTRDQLRRFWVTYRRVRNRVVR